MGKSGPHKPKKNPPVVVGKNYVKEWRLLRDYTVADLAERAGLSQGTISGIENSRVGFSPDSLDKIAHALKTTTGNLLNHDPSADGAESFWQLWEKATPKDRETLTIMAKRLVDTKERK